LGYNIFDQSRFGFLSFIVTYIHRLFSPLHTCLQLGTEAFSLQLRAELRLEELDDVCRRLTRRQQLPQHLTGWYFQAGAEVIAMSSLTPLHIHQ